MQEVTLYQACPQCGGTGEYKPATGPGTGGPYECQWDDCDGTGFITWGKYSVNPGSDDLLDKINDVLDKCNDILEKLNE